MKLLKARQYVTCQHAPLKGIKPKVTVVSVKDLMLTADYEWMIKRYPAFKTSIESAGMKFPIIYTDLEHYWLKRRWKKDEEGNCIPGLSVHTGNKRVYWAKKNGFTHIEGYFVNNKLYDTKNNPLWKVYKKIINENSEELAEVLLNIILKVKLFL